jgi:hypothetical protein
VPALIFLAAVLVGQAGGAERRPEAPSPAPSTVLCLAGPQCVRLLVGRYTAASGRQELSDAEWRALSVNMEDGLVLAISDPSRGSELAPRLYVVMDPNGGPAAAPLPQVP